MNKIVPRWIRREPPLVACAVAARGVVARHLAQRVLEYSDDELTKLTGVATPDILFLLGANKTLPWTDGAHYFGRDESAPSLLLPTTQTLDVPLPLFESALLQSSTRSGHNAPLAVFPDGTCVSLLGARPIARDVLETWLRHHS